MWQVKESVLPKSQPLAYINCFRHTTQNDSTVSDWRLISSRRHPRWRGWFFQTQQRSGARCLRRAPDCVGSALCFATVASFSCSCTQEQNHTQWTPPQYFMEEVHWYRLSWGYLQRALYIIHLRLLWPGSFVLTKDWMGGCDSVCTAHIQLFLSPLWTRQRWNDITPPFSPWIIYTAAGSEVDLHLKSVHSSAPRPCWLSLDHI